MKKLLSILIYLFMSFEVRSESDDLSGKKLFCDSNYNIHGFEFLNNFKVKHIIFYKKDGSPMETEILNYETTNIRIKISGGKRGYIDRMTLGRLNYSLNKYGSCQIFTGDLELLLNKKRNEIVKKLKSKQKI